MRKEIKQEILQVSKALFNERGYNEVSTQDIAGAMGISKGNLSYHFKRKEDILEAVVEEMHSHYVRPEPPCTLEELGALFCRVQRVARENAFYFWDYTQLAQTSGRIREIQSAVIQDHFALFSEALRLLHGDGSLRAEEYPGQYGQIVRAMMLVCTYWTPHSRLAQGVLEQVDFLDCIWGIVYPLLTERGKLQYRAIHSALPRELP